ncbi:MAG: UTP--glucose-1-phosphate uridylyltransferase [Ruminococcaceae bacterium]|nr:UTP--glucose-1-phosphate uridylyltransferase [Oscillospiraceae bacterium]
MKVKKAVILAAGLGTRMLPATKSVPKELFPIVDKPALQYLVEELVNSGITDIMIVLSRGKTLIEDHFDRSPELEDRLIAGGASKAKMLEQVREIENMANIVYVRQKTMNGTGGAVQMARQFTGNDPFVVLYGDDVIINNEYPVSKQLIDVYEEFEKGVAGVQEVSREAIKKYSTMDVTKIRDNIYDLTDMIEKPTEEQILSLFSILGRIVLPASIYDYLDKTPLGANNELQLTDAMQLLANDGQMVAVDFVGKRYDMGNKLGVMQAQVEQALNHPEIGADFREYLKEFCKTL